MKRAEQRHAALTGWVALFLLILTSLVVVVAGTSISSSASASGGITAPLPVSTAETATALAGGGSPPGVGTAGPNPVATGGSGPATGGTGTTNTPAQSSGGSFPWLIVLAIALVVLAALGYAAMRQRQPATVAATRPATGVVPRTEAQPAPTDAAMSSTTTVGTTAEGGDAIAPIAVPPVTAPLVTAGTAATAAATVPTTVTCPNCGTENSTAEKFCHECGQDLRPVVAQMGVAPIDVVEEDTPYLETLDRADEQLEFVLSRPRIVIGTAAGNDIVIDAAFKGWQTVSPVHAELRRDF